MKQSCRPLLFAACLAALTLPAHAATIVGVGEPPGDDRGFNGTVGFEFTVNTANLTVTELGAWDEDSNGFTDSVIVGLWDTAATPNLLASVTLPAGMSGTLDDQTRFLALGSGNEVDLIQGDSYVLAANFDSDTLKDNAPSGSAATYFSSDFTFEQARWEGGSGLNFPTNTTGDDEFFGANMTVVPEPSTTLLMLGSLGLLTLRRSRRS